MGGDGDKLPLSGAAGPAPAHSGAAFPPAPWPPALRASPQREFLRHAGLFRLFVAGLSRRERKTARKQRGRAAGKGTWGQTPGTTLARHTLPWAANAQTPAWSSLPPRHPHGPCSSGMSRLRSLGLSPGTALPWCRYSKANPRQCHAMPCRDGRPGGGSPPGTSRDPAQVPIWISRGAVPAAATPGDKPGSRGSAAPV